MSRIDPKVAIWILGIVFLAGGGWYSLGSVSADVEAIQATLDEQATAVTVHVANPEAHDDARIKRLEVQQTVIAEDVKSLMTNQSAICQATGARCR
jgi:hypothetical protein